MDQLKLMALDVEDLKILSAHLQDAVLKVSDIDWKPKEQRLVLALNRFVWEGAQGKWFKREFERRRAALSFSRVKGLKVRGIDRTKPNEVLALLALDFTASEAPSGSVDILFAGGATARLEVECIEVQLRDLGSAWSTKNKPDHDQSSDASL